VAHAVRLLINYLFEWYRVAPATDKSIAINFLLKLYLRLRIISAVANAQQPKFHWFAGCAAIRLPRQPPAASNPLARLGFSSVLCATLVQSRALP
jgi:hypothetical protein